jgi:hypothetical protein
MSYALNLTDPVMKKLIEVIACNTEKDRQIKMDIERIKIRHEFACCCSVPKPD